MAKYKWSAKCKLYRPNRIFTSLMTFENYLYPGSKDVFLAVCCEQLVSYVWDLDQMLALHFSNYSLVIPAQKSFYTQFRKISSINIEPEHNCLVPSRRKMWTFFTLDICWLPNPRCCDTVFTRVLQNRKKPLFKSLIFITCLEGFLGRFHKKCKDCAWCLRNRKEKKRRKPT